LVDQVIHRIYHNIEIVHFFAHWKKYKNTFENTNIFVRSLSASLTCMVFDFQSDEEYPCLVVDGQTYLMKRFSNIKGTFVFFKIDDVDLIAHSCNVFQAPRGVILYQMVTCEK